MSIETKNQGNMETDDQVALKESVEAVGELVPVLKNSAGEIIDGVHRKKLNPKWREEVVPLASGLKTLRARVHVNLVRRRIPIAEKQQWVAEAQKLLQAEGKKGTTAEIALALGKTQPWVSDYNLEPAVRGGKGGKKHRKRNLARHAKSRSGQGDTPEPEPQPSPAEAITSFERKALDLYDLLNPELYDWQGGRFLVPGIVDTLLLVGSRLAKMIQFLEEFRKSE